MNEILKKEEIMKTIAIILLTIPFWATNSLAQEKDVTGLLSNQDTRTAIFNTILNDHHLMMDFMDAMKDNNHAMMMMRSDSVMMDHMPMGGMPVKGDHQMMGMNHGNSDTMEQMMSMMKQNPEMMQKMMASMMDMCEKDSTQCEHMAEVMSQHPHMMMMGMQKMKEKE